MRTSLAAKHGQNGHDFTFQSETRLNSGRVARWEGLKAGSLGGEEMWNSGAQTLNCISAPRAPDEHLLKLDCRLSALL